MSSEYTLKPILIAQTDMSQTYKNFSLKINKLTTFSEITKVWQCVKIVFIRSDEFTYNFNFTLCLKPEIDPTTPNIKTCNLLHLQITQPSQSKYILLVSFR